MTALCSGKICTIFPEKGAPNFWKACTIALEYSPEMADTGLSILICIIFSVSYTQLLHNKMLKNDRDYKVNVMDERNISIKEKSGNITNMITMVLLGIATVIFISFDYLIPAIITGVIILVQPIILIIVSNMIEKKM